MDNFQLFLSVMLFYAILTFLIGPLIGYYLGGKTLLSAGNGFIVGSLLSIVLWLVVGKNLVKK
jgi:hypothetical protein